MYTAPVPGVTLTPAPDPIEAVRAAVLAEGELDLNDPLLQPILELVLRTLRHYHRIVRG
jgi:hypothetical protein